MNALRVAYLVNQYPAGSHTFVRREIHALERRGLVVERMALRGWSEKLVDAQDVEERILTGYVLKRGASGLAGALLRQATRSPRHLWRAARLALQMSHESERPWPIHLVYLAEACVVRAWAESAQVVHLHAHFATNSAEVAMLAHALGGPRYSFTAHGSDIMDRPAQVGLPLTVGSSAFTVAVCSFGRGQIYRWVPHTLWERIHVVRCGLQPGYGSGSPSAAHSRRLLCIGRLSKEKGQLLLVEAAKRLADAGIDFEIVLVGDGPMRQTVEELIARLHLGDRIRVAGWLDAAGVEKELHEARALVVPSLSEGLPVVIMEAMAAARPVVAPFLAGIPELVQPGRNGWLFPAGDTAGLAQAMQACLSVSASEWLSLGQAARNDVWTAHDVDVEAGKLATLFADSGASR